MATGTLGAAFLGVPVGGQDEYFRSGAYTWSKPATLKEALRDGDTPGDWVERTRTDLPKHDKRCYIHDVDPYTESTDSRPFTYDEATAYFSAPPPPVDWRETGVIPATDPYAVVRQRYDREQAEAELAMLREACVIPQRTMMRLWDFKKAQPRRVRDMHGQLTTWEYAVADDVASELGYESGEALIRAVEAQAGLYARIRQLRRML